MKVDQNTSRNLILRSLSGEDFAILAARLNQVTLEVGEVLASPGQDIGTIHFPENGIVTYSDFAGNGERVGIAHTGYEGFAGWPVLLGCPQSAHEARVTNDGGAAWQIGSEDLIDLCRSSETLHNHLLRFVRAVIVQFGRTIVSSLTQPVETRLARWTLMAHDRVVADEVRVTHDEIAVMLAVRRATVTDALHILEGEGLIRSLRGRVVIRDRPGLKRLAGEAYGFYEAEYSRLIAPFPRHPA
jgi:CRP-like cAMP-binding protein